jgi:glutamine---fructose-6-phosphate transaminase (isomerizing)
MTRKLISHLLIDNLKNFISSDQLALLPITNRFIYLEEGDIARLTRNSIEVFVAGQLVERPIKELDAAVSNASKGEYKHGNEFIWMVSMYDT